MAQRLLNDDGRHDGKLTIASGYDEEGKGFNISLFGSGATSGSHPLGKRDERKKMNP